MSTAHGALPLAPAGDSVARPDFLVVGVVSSAGGLDALKKMLGALPAAPGMAFVLVPHLDPGHDSLMPELLTGHTPMPVTEAADGVVTAVDHVYVIPSNTTLTIRGGILRRGPPPGLGAASGSIDLFLRSLAEDQGERAVGVVLSGTGSHGAAGLREIKARGGRTAVQDPSTAAFPAMPRAAVDQGLADRVVAPEQIPAALAAFAAAHARGPSGVPAAERAAGVMQVMDLVLARTGQDFRAYRPGMLARRVERRVGLKGLPGVPEYLGFLADHPDEVAGLVGDLMIGVTHFFRDPGAFAVLESEVIPAILRSKRPDQAVRVWVPACATGEEAYSVAMLLLEQFGPRPAEAGFQVFATDLDPVAVAAARTGVFGDDELSDLSAARRDRFFVPAGDGKWKVAKHLREAVVFSRQNLLSDPPYLRIDLISCRNLLIYLDPPAQHRVLSLFALALNPGGYLILGPSESLGGQPMPFEVVSGIWRVFRRTHQSWGGWAGVELPASGARPGAAGVAPAPASAAAPARAAAVAAEVLLAEYAPAAALVDEQNQVLYLSGSASLYLELPVGEPTRDLLRMARRGLRGVLRRVLGRTRRDGQTTNPTAAWVWRDAGYHPVRVGARPVLPPQVPQPLFLVVFEEPGGDPARAAPAAPDVTLVDHLRQEVMTAEEFLQRTLADHQAANEDLTAANEEMTSVNEELRSAVEELESSKEELQSLNEELISANAQLREKAQALSVANADIANLLNSTDLAAVFVGPDGRIRRFTPAAARLFHLLPADAGRPLADIAPFSGDAAGRADIEATFRDAAVGEREVAAADGRWYLRRTLPYRAADDRVMGAILTYSDVTPLKQAELALLRNKELARLAAVLLDSSDAVAVIEPDGQITAWNRGAERLYGYTEAEAKGLTIEDLIPEPRRSAERALLGRVRLGEPPENWETQRVARDGRVLDVWVTATLLRDAAGRPAAVSTTDRDVTAQKRLERDLQERNDRMTAILGAAADAIVTIDGAGVIESVNPATERIFGHAAGDLVGRPVTVLMPSPDRDNHGRYIANYLSTGEKKMIGAGREVVALRKDGTTFPADLSVGQIDGLPRFVGIVRDTTHRKQLERDVLGIATEEQARIGRELHDTVGQEITGLRLMAETLVGGLRDQQSPDYPLGARICKGMQEVLERVRSISHGLLPPEIEADGLGAALTSLAAHTRESGGVDCSFNQSGAARVPGAGVATQLLRIAQEAVCNALKHAHPRRVIITLTASGSSVEMRVADDGVGFREPPPEADGLGLKLMRYRAGLINASFRIDSGPQGTQVSCTLRMDTPREQAPNSPG